MLAALDKIRDLLKVGGGGLPQSVRGWLHGCWELAVSTAVKSLLFKKLGVLVLDGAPSTSITQHTINQARCGSYCEAVPPLPAATI